MKSKLEKKIAENVDFISRATVSLDVNFIFF